MIKLFIKRRIITQENVNYNFNQITVYLPKDNVRNIFIGQGEDFSRVLIFTDIDR